MKKLLCILFVFFALITLFSCKHNSIEATENNSTTTKANLSETDVNSAKTDTGFMESDISKESVSEFMDLLGHNIEGAGLLAGYKLDEEHCYNVTPTAVAEETDMKIFKFSDSCASFVMLDNKIYSLCEYFGGYGFVSAVPCDFDNDGNKDLLVTSSFGSGLHRSVISVFNSVTKKSTVIHDTSETDTPRVDLIATREQPSSLSPEQMKSFPFFYQIYSVRIESNDGNLAHLKYVATGVHGAVTAENGKPLFEPYQG